MTLGFSQQINGKPNLFIEKIWLSLPLEINPQPFYDKHYEVFGTCWDVPKVVFKEGQDPLKTLVKWEAKPKVHTIRHDPKDRWKAGKLIHPVINNRKANRFQFAPAFPCVSTQKIEIEWCDSGTLLGRYARVYIDSTRYMGIYEEKENKWQSTFNRDSLENLAQNDGFNSVADFFTYFNADFKGKIIHWTDLKY